MSLQTAIDCLDWNEKKSADFVKFTEIVASEKIITSDSFSQLSSTIDFSRIEYALHAFKGVLEDIGVYQKKAADKKINFEIDYKIRQAILRNIFILEQVISDNIFYNQQQIKRDQLFIKQSQLEELDINAFVALKKYRSKTQKKMAKIAWWQNFCASISFGVIETGVSVTAFIAGFTGLVQGFKLLLNIGAYLLGAISSWVSIDVNMRSGTPYIFSPINKSIGDGSWRHYYCEATGQFERLSDTQLKQLAVVAACSVLVGVSGGAVAYSAMLSFTALPYLLGIVAVSTACPPLGIFFAGIVILGNICMFTMNFYYKVLTKGPPTEDLPRKMWNFLKKPFNELKETIDKWEISNTQKDIAYWGGIVLTVTCCLLGMAGLAISSWNGSTSFNKFSKNVFHAGPKVAKMLGIFISGVIGALGRTIFTLFTALESSVVIIKAFSKKTREKLNRWTDLVTTIAETSMRFAFFYQSFATKTDMDRKADFTIASVATSRNFLLNTAHLVKKPIPLVDFNEKRIHKLLAYSEEKKHNIIKDSGLYSFKKTYTTIHSERSFEKLIKDKSVIEMQFFRSSPDPKVKSIVSLQADLDCKESILVKSTLTK